MRIYCLEGLDVEKRLKEEGFKDDFIKNHSMKWHYLITRILFMYYRKPRHVGDGKVKIHATSLKNILGRTSSKSVPKKYRAISDDTYLLKIIRKSLKSWGVIIDSPIYKKTNSYVLLKIKDEWDVDFTEYKNEIPDAFIYLHHKYKIEKVFTPPSGIYRKLYVMFTTISLDTEKSLEYIKSLLDNPDKVQLKNKQDKRGKWHERFFDLKSYHYYKFIIDNYDELRFFVVTKDTKRIYSSIGNLPKLLRPFLRTKDGEELVETDVSNSQPRILPKLYGVHVDPIYKDLVDRGEFYKYVQAICHERGIATSKPSNFKVDLFSSVFFSKNHFKWKSKLESLFEECFPETYFSIRLRKMRNYKSLSIELQTAEANLVIGKACSKLIDEFGITNIVTIHDSILATRENELTVIKVLEEVYK